MHIQWVIWKLRKRSNDSSVGRTVLCTVVSPVSLTPVSQLPVAPLGLLSKQKMAPLVQWMPWAPWS